MLTYSSAVDDGMSLLGWLGFRQGQLSNLQLSKGGPVGVNEREKRDGWLVGEKEEKREKMCERQGFAQHYITLISQPHLPSLLLSNISD